MVTLLLMENMPLRLAFSTSRQYFELNSALLDIACSNPVCLKKLNGGNPYKTYSMPAHNTQTLISLARSEHSELLMATLYDRTERYILSTLGSVMIITNWCSTHEEQAKKQDEVCA